MFCQLPREAGEVTPTGPQPETPPLLLTAPQSLRDAPGSWSLGRAPPGVWQQREKCLAVACWGSSNFLSCLPTSYSPWVSGETSPASLYLPPF